MNTCSSEMEDDPTSLELLVMCREYEWLLGDEVVKVLEDLKSILTEILRNFRLRCEDSEDDVYNEVKPEKFLLSCPSGMQQSKCMVTLAGDLISEADVGVRLPKQPVIIYQTRVYPEVPWRLQQVQDAGNHLRLALSLVDGFVQTSSSSISPGAQVLSFLEDVTSHLKLGRESLSMPKMQSLEVLMKSPNNKVFRPPLPQDTFATFFVQTHKLILAVYHVATNTPNRTEIISRYQLECSIPWLNTALLLFTLALHKCQQLKDKMVLFSHYKAPLNSIRLTGHRPDERESGYHTAKRGEKDAGQDMGNRGEGGASKNVSAKRPLDTEVSHPNDRQSEIEFHV